MEPLLLPEVENSSAPWKGEIGGNNGSKMEASLSLDVEKKDISSSMSRRRERGANSKSKTEPLLPPEVENSSAPCKGEIERNNGSKMELPLFTVIKKMDMSLSMSRRREREANFESKAKPLLPPDVKGTVEENIDSKMKPLLPLQVEKNDMSSNAWRTNLQEFPAFPERRDGEHISFTLRHPLRTPNVKGIVEADIESKTEPLLPQDMKEGIVEADIESKMEPLLPTDVRSIMVEANIESKTEPLLSSAVEKEDMSWRINLEGFPKLPERRDAEHGSSILRFLRTPRKQRKVNDYYKKLERLIEGFTEMETMIETGRAPGNLTEDEMKQLAKSVRMAIYVTNTANIVLFAAKVFASIESKSLAVIASILAPLFDLLWGFILWFTSHAMQNPNQHRYPIGKKRMQPVGIIIFGSFGLQVLFQAAQQFITKSVPEKDPQKEKWIIGIMTSVTLVKFMLAVYCRRFKDKIVRAYAEHHFSDVKTNLISLAAVVLASRYYWWIDPTGAIIILLYTMNTWKKTFFENLFALIGRTAPPEFLGKLTYLIWNHHEDIKKIDTVRAYTFGSDHYFVEVDIVLPQDMVLSKTHDIGETLQEKLEQLPEVARAFVHIDSEYTHRPEHKTMV
ncbi:metal tolerance protein 9-like [Quercus robur]|uniref:metal tolerance protein 9-like n=1 Tax=Quercus robur TaxID=38942 RepID=UPI0021613A16|nr:metal tolerance protein 9-like [Quercus robur]